MLLVSTLSGIMYLFTGERKNPTSEQHIGPKFCDAGPNVYRVFIHQKNGITEYDFQRMDHFLEFNLPLHNVEHYGVLSEHELIKAFELFQKEVKE